VEDVHAASREVAETARWRKSCAIFGLLFLLITQYAKLIYYDYHHLTTYQDFPQYYMGGLIARVGAWNALYPIPKPGAMSNPGAPENSTMRPRYAKLAEQSGIGDNTRYIQPPPLALVLIPLSWLPAHVSFYLWHGLLCLAAWGISLQAARIYEICAESDAAAGIASARNIPGTPPQPRSWRTLAPGILILLICLSPQAHRWVRVGNMSPIVGWLIGIATLALVRRTDGIGAVALFFGAVAKYALLVLAPLYLAMRRWRVIVYCLILAAGMLIASLIAMRSLEPYRTFINQIVPTLSRTRLLGENQALYPTILRMTNRETMPPELAMVLRCIEFACLALILVIIFAAPQRYWRHPPNVFCAALALIAWLLVFSPITWEHYFSYLAPFWGWMVYQAGRSKSRAIVTIAAIALSYVPITLIHGIRLPEPIFSHLFWSMLLTLLLALWVMLRDQAESSVTERSSRNA
jgi:hypothetical protein